MLLRQPKPLLVSLQQQQMCNHSALVRGGETAEETAPGWSQRDLEQPPAVQ